MFFGETVRDCYTTVSFSVDTLHLVAEEPAVGRGVAEMVDGDVIMDHLMKDGIFDEVFGQVDTGVDTQNEVLVARRAKEPGAMLGKGQFAEERAGMGELDRDRRKGATEEADIVLVKAGLYVRNRWDHFGFMISNL